MLDTIILDPQDLTSEFLARYNGGNYILVQRHRQDFATISNLRIEKFLGFRHLSWEMLDLWFQGVQPPRLPYSRSKAPISYGMFVASQRFEYTQRDGCLSIFSRMGGSSYMKMFPSGSESAWIAMSAPEESDRVVP